MSARIFSRRHKQMTFSDAVFLGALRVKCIVQNILIPSEGSDPVAYWCTLISAFIVCISRVERKTSVSQMVVFPQT